jgi:hypothetical protein
MIFKDRRDFEKPVVVANQYGYCGRNPKQVIDYNVRKFGIQNWADLIDVNSAHVSNVVNGLREPSPTIIRRMRKLELIPPKEKRVRISADLPSEYHRRVLHEGSKILGFENWGGFVNALAEEWEGMDSNAELELLEQKRNVKVITVNT